MSNKKVYSPPNMYKLFLRLVCILTVSFFCNSAKGTDTTYVVVKGIADLRNIDLGNKSVSLNGEWAFSWNRLLDATDNSAFASFTSFPGLWNSKTINGQKLSTQGCATYRLRILLPAKRGQLALNIPDFYSSYRLYLNGKLFSSAGTPATNAARYSPQWLNRTIAIDDMADTLELTLQMANFSHAKGGPKKSITIGSNESMQSSRETILAGDFLLSGCLFMGGLFFFGLYLFGKNDRATLYFSLFCMLYSYRIIGSNSYALLSVFPHISWQLAIRLEYLTLFGSILLCVQYVRALYPDDLDKLIVNWLTFFCIGVSTTPLLLPTLIFTHIIDAFLVLMFFCIVYVLVVFTRAYMKKRPGAEYALLSIAVLMLVMLLINLQYFGLLVPSGTIIFAGYIAFFFLQSLVLSFRFAYALKTAKQQAEEGLKAKSEFLSTMSHEIRTPLNSVIGMSHLMLENNPRKDQKEQLDVLLFSAGNLLSIVNNILDYSKIEAGRLVFEHIEMDIEHILRNIVSGFRNAASQKGIMLEVNVLTPIYSKVIGDPTSLTQVISNLTGNAVKFTQEGKVVIEVIVETETTDELTVTFKIKDSGIGISKEKQKLIFEQFTQADSSTSRSYGGTGLGLAISKKILKLQGAELKVESDNGEGAVFYFTQVFLKSKTIAGPAGIMPPVLPANAKPLSNVVILLVEDNPMNVFVAKSFLESWGATIDVAVNGQEALEKLDINRHKLVLMDLHMPVMDGYDATRKIRERGIRIPIIALTASLPNEIEEEVKELDVDSVLLKPFVPGELYKSVLQYTRTLQPLESELS